MKSKKSQNACGDGRITWGEESSSLELRGSMETTTLATGRDGSEASEGGVRRERDTRGGHFMSHTAFSALEVSKYALLVMLPLL